MCALPQTGAFTDVQNVYDWLNGFLQSTWKDPVCGDGVCEQPFEFAYYGHFGCKARVGGHRRAAPLRTPLRIAEAMQGTGRAQDS